MSPKWDEVGLQLDIAPHVLETVVADHRDVETRCKTMFKKWLHSGEGTGKQPRTWESVQEAVRRAVGSEVYANIEQDIVQGELYHELTVYRLLFMRLATSVISVSL